MPRLIDADVLKEKILSLTGMFDDGGFYVGVDAVLGMIDFQNAIEPESLRPHGRWVWDENAMDWGLGGWICSECQERNDNIPAKPDIHPSGWVGSHFCPNCGAKMDGDLDG